MSNILNPPGPSLSIIFHCNLQQTSNGYFAAWAIMYGCVMTLGMDSSTFKSNVRGLGAVMGHAAAALVFLIACITKVQSGATVSGSARNNAIYGLSLACFSAVTVFVLMVWTREVALSLQL